MCSQNTAHILEKNGKRVNTTFFPFLLPLSTICEFSMEGIIFMSMQTVKYECLFFSLFFLANKIGKVSEYLLSVIRCCCVRDLCPLLCYLYRGYRYDPPPPVSSIQLDHPSLILLRVFFGVLLLAR